MVFQQKLLEKTFVIVEITGPAMVRPVSSDFWKAPLDSGFQYMSVERGFWIPVVSGIPNSLSCIPDFTSTEFSWIPDSASKNFPDSGIQINSSS